MMELAEPDAEQLQAMVQFGAERLTGDHGIGIDTEAVAAAIELTNNYRADSAGMDRAQPERSVTLLDRALASYRLEAHEKPPHLAQLQARIAAAKGDEAKALTDQIARATQEWNRRKVSCAPPTAGSAKARRIWPGSTGRSPISASARASSAPPCPSARST